jgi:hypothetical protein
MDSIKSLSGHVTLNLCFCIRSDLRVTLCIPVCPGHEMSSHYFLCSSGPGAVSIKSAPGHITPNLCFCIRWDLQVMWCNAVCPGTKRDCTIFRLGWDWYRFDKNHATTRCAELVFFNPAGYTGHVAHSIASESSNVTALLLMLGWAGTDSIKSTPRQVTPNLCFCVRWDL